MTPTNNSESNPARISYFVFRIYIIIVAAGRGSRFGGDLPKQYCMLADKPVLVHTVERFAKALPDAKIAVVLHPNFKEYWEELADQYGLKTTIIFGGDTRWQSVKNAIEALQPEPDSVVMVHDGARPIVPSDMLLRITDAMRCADAAIPVIPVTDSLRQIGGDALASPNELSRRPKHRPLNPGDTEVSPTSRAVDRSRLVAVQTPQAFRADKLVEAYRLPFSPSFTDDASVYEAAGYGSPVLVEGSPLNIKITNPRDIAVAQLFL